MSAYEYRVVWKRVGLRKKARTSAKIETARRTLALLNGGSGRYLALGLDPDELACCSGRECGCRGLTNREVSDAYVADMPPLEYARIEAREVGEWKVSS